MVARVRESGGVICILRGIDMLIERELELFIGFEKKLKRDGVDSGMKI